MGKTISGTRLSEEIAKMLDNGADASAIADRAVCVMREDLQSGAAHSGGTTCPTCDQRAVVRRTAITPLHMEALAIAYAEVGADTGLFFHAPSLIHQDASRPLTDFSVLSWFGVVEPLCLTRAYSGADTEGMYRLTEMGVKFLRGEASVAKAVRIYNGEVVSASDVLTTADEIWGKPFDVEGAAVRAPEARRGIMAAHE